MNGETSRYRVERQRAELASFWQRDVLTGRVLITAEWKALLGYEDHELPGDFNEFQSRLHPEDHDDILRTLHEQLAHGHFELPTGLRLRHRDGSYRWLHRPVVPNKSLSEPPSAASGPAGSQTAAERHAAWLASFPDLDPNPIAELDFATGLLHYLNPTARRLFPTLESEGLRHPFLAGLRESAADLIKSGVTCRDVTMGHACFAQTVHYLPEAGRVRLYAIEVTERKRSEDSLREAEAQLRLAVAASNVGLWDWDLVTNEVFFSKEWKSQLGCTEEEISNQFSEWEDRVHPEDLAPTLAKVRHSIAHPDVRFEAEFRLRHKDGSYRWIYTQAQVARDPAGKPVRMLGCHIDITERKASEAAARAGEARYRALVRSATDAIITADEHGVIVSWNPAAERLFGWGESEAKGQPLTIIIPERFRAAHLAGISRVQAGGPLRVMAKPVEFTGLHRDGREFPIELSLVHWQSEAGQFFGGVIRDISERKRAEQALQVSEQRYQDVFDNSHDLIQSVAPDGHLLLVNRAWRQTFGYTEAEVPGLTVMDLVHPDSREHCGALFQQVMSAGQEQPVVATFATKSGQRVLVEGTATPRVVEGQVTVVHCSLRDVTARQQSEHRLRLQAAALNAAANEVIFTDRHGVIEWVNPAFTRTTGYTLAEVVGQNPRILKSGQHDQAFYKHLWATILRGEVWRGEIINQRKDGSHFTEEAIITPVKDERGEITHFIAIKQDISDRKLLEAKFLRAQRLEGLGALAGGVAHDLNNVLAPILMASELLKSQAPDPQIRQLLEMVEGNSQRGAGMIRQILAFARGTAGEKIVLQVPHLLKEISKMIKDTFPPAIRCELSVGKDVPTVLADATALYQVLLNLCVNARDAMPQGGSLTLGAERVRLDEAYAHLSQEARPGDYLVLTVADTGGGIPPEVRDKIFEPFFTTKEPGKGTGLGLATVKDIVTNHGGFIHFYSDVGVGTQFKLYLPAVDREEAAGDTTLLTLPVGHGELVLVVDDEAAVREIVKATLEGYGYRVVTAEDGTQAVARFVEHLQEVQLLLTDMQMPHMDGSATIRALRNIQPGLRVVATSGLTAHQAALKARGLEVQGFVAKPFTAASLLLALDVALHPQGSGAGEG
ncbi:MAG: hypothetical protein B9S33_02520 [Pedosphaera sp. Tous-C6FEB]|nr:MAG: hypothetical protein B9S33_02520 [Pedosphaera sp. Tous-C6FEB]